MSSILAGEAEESWIGAFLVGLRLKVETPAEIAGFAEAMRAHATPIVPTAAPLVDTCGTGGDASGSFNSSTAAAFVAAGAGAHVAKHGNRSVSSKSGSADVLEALGARLDLSPSRVGQCIDEVGFGFLFAPALHGAMKHAVGPRKALALRTVFNILGPLTNPAGAPHQVLGVFDASLLETMGEVLHDLGSARSLLVHGDDGLDELTITTTSQAMIIDGGLRHEKVDPSRLGLSLHEASSIAGGDPQKNAGIIVSVLEGAKGGARDVVALNAAAALFACGLADDLESGVAQALVAIEDGSEREILDRYVEFTKRYGGET
jgi:anthranilate phosphoribosyltransferase